MWRHGVSVRIHSVRNIGVTDLDEGILSMWCGQVIKSKYALRYKTITDRFVLVGVFDRGLKRDSEKLDIGI